jgi:4'-phosphopantetheinyl transferase EntD
VIEEILPAGIAHAEAFDDSAEVALFPEEQAVITRAVDKRRREFTTARHCARIALAQLGCPPVPLVPGPKGEPRWPDGLVGSMTHCAGYRAAAVARSRELRAVGIDAEPHAALPEEALDLAASDAERERLERLAHARPGVHWDRILFCTQEAVYKAWFPLTRRWLDFADVSTTLRLDGTFRARVPGDSFSGRWVVDRGLVVAAIAVRP